MQPIKHQRQVPLQTVATNMPYHFDHLQDFAAVIVLSVLLLSLSLVFVFKLLHLLPISYPFQLNHRDLVRNHSFIIAVIIRFLALQSNDQAVDHRSSLFQSKALDFFQLRCKCQTIPLALDPEKYSLQKLCHRCS